MKGIKISNEELIVIQNQSEAIGSGSYGEVYVRQFKEEKVAYKKFKFIVGLPIGEWFNEVSTMRKLNHKNIVRFIGVVAESNSDKYGLVMEFYENGSLFNQIHKVIFKWIWQFFIFFYFRKEKNSNQKKLRWLLKEW